MAQATRVTVRRARFALVTAAAVPVTILVGAMLTGAFGSLAFGAGAFVAIFLVLSSRGTLEAYSEATPEGTRHNPALFEAGYLRYCAREARLDPRVVRNVIWGLWAPLAVGWVFLVLYAAWDLARAGISGFQN